MMISWLLFMLSCIEKRHECKQIQFTNYQAFYESGKYETFKGVNFVVY